MEDKRIVQGKLMNTHRMVINEIADIKSKNIEPTEEDQKKIKKSSSCRGCFSMFK